MYRMSRYLFSVELSDSLATFGNGVLSEIAWEDKPDSGLDFAGSEGVPVVHVDKAGAFAGDPLEDVGNEGVHDEHGLVGDTDIWVDLLEDLEDVGGERLGALLVAELLVLLCGIDALDGWLLLCWCLGCWLL